MKQLAVWNVTDQGPQKLGAGDVGLEKNLEDWIQQQPELLMSGLTIVGRQVNLGGIFLDLLGISPEGRWVAIELKAGKLYRETLAQALDYSSVIGTIDADELLELLDGCDEDARELVDEVLDQEDPDTRDVVSLVAGTSVDPGLERITEFLASRYDVPIRIVSFEVFATDDGQQLLVREVSERETSPKKRGVSYSIERIRQLAAEKGSSEVIGEFLEVGKRHGLHIKPWPTSLTLNPPAHKAFTLFYAQPQSHGNVRIGWHMENLEQFYEVSEKRADELLGSENWESSRPEKALDLIRRIDTFLSETLPPQRDHRD